MNQLNCRIRVPIDDFPNFEYAVDQLINQVLNRYLGDTYRSMYVPGKRTSKLRIIYHWECEKIVRVAYYNSWVIIEFPNPIPHDFFEN